MTMTVVMLLLLLLRAMSGVTHIDHTVPVKVVQSMGRIPMMEHALRSALLSASTLPKRSSQVRQAIATWLEVT